MSEYDAVIGKTIARVINMDEGYDGALIVFTDGTSLEVRGDGYEDSCVTPFLRDVDGTRERHLEYETWMARYRPGVRTDV